MTTSLLALLLSWTPVTTDCLGMSDGICGYEVRYMLRVCEDWTSDTPPPCETLMMTATQRETEFRSLGDPIPQVGSGYWYEITTIDGAGHRSDECSQ